MSALKKEKKVRPGTYKFSAWSETDRTNAFTTAEKGQSTTLLRVTCYDCKKNGRQGVFVLSMISVCSSVMNLGIPRLALTFLQSHGGEVGGGRPLSENLFHQTLGIADPSYTGCLVSSTSYLLQSTLAVDVDI